MAVTINGSTGISGVDGSAATPALQGGDTNTGIVFGTDTVGVSTGGVQRTTVDSSGRLLVGIGSANANGGVLQLSGGITFPGTQVGASDVNTLDDYEEGTFTASFTGSSSTFTSFYAKIGRLVYVAVYGGGINVSSSVEARVYGFPFTGRSTYAIFSLAHNTYTLNGGGGGYLSTDSTSFYFTPEGSTSNTSTNVGNPRYLMMSGCYITD